MLVGLHQEWCEHDDASAFPPAENIHILTSASQQEVEGWVTGIEADGVVAGWPYGKPANAPEPSAGYTVFSVCWD